MNSENNKDSKKIEKKDWYYPTEEEWEKKAMEHAKCLLNVLGEDWILPKDKPRTR